MDVMDVVTVLVDELMRVEDEVFVDVVGAVVVDDVVDVLDEVVDVVVLELV